MATNEPVNKFLEDPDSFLQMESVIKQFGITNTLTSCALSLITLEPKKVREVIFFIRSMAGGNDLDKAIIEETRPFIPELVLPSLRKLLLSPSYMLRLETIYAFGKMSYFEEKQSLYDVLPFYISKDPLGLFDLLMELSWLEQSEKNLTTLAIDQAINAPLFLSRWATLSFLDHIMSVFDGTKWVNILVNDPHPLVKNEAIFIQSKANFERQGESENWYPKDKWRKTRKDLQAQEPKITFFNLKHNLFTKDCWPSNSNYEIADIEKYL